MKPRGDSLIFDWPGRHTLHLALPACVVIAFLLHAGLFSLFAIIYPRAEPAGPSPAMVFFVPERSADHARLESILQTEDPAIFAPGRGIFQGGLRSASRYTPGYETEKASLELLPALPGIEGGRNVRSGPVPLAGRRKPDPRPPESRPTQLVAGEPLASRLPAMLETTGFQSLPGQSLEPTGFLVSVRADGSVAHILTQSTSGNAQIDARALMLLGSLRFLPLPGGGDVWGEVSFHWGSDIRTAEAQ